MKDPNALKNGRLVNNTAMDGGRHTQDQHDTELR